MVASTAALAKITDATRLAARPDDLIWRLKTEQYHAMIDAGILTDDDPVELLEGWLVYKMPKSPRHRLVTRLVRRKLEAIVPPGWYVESQEPVTIDDSEPEPDVSVIRGQERDFARRHPGAGDVALVIEVADTTLARDRTRKKRLYARAAIAPYWIVNLVDGVVEVYDDLAGSGGRHADYQTRQDYEEGDAIPVVIEGQIVGVVAVADFLALV